MAKNTEDSEKDFDRLLKAGFDLYAKEKLAEIPDMKNEPGNYTLYGKCIEKIRKPKPVLAGIMLSACLCSLLLAVFIFAKVVSSDSPVTPPASADTTGGYAPATTVADTRKPSVTTVTTTTRKTDRPIPPKTEDAIASGEFNMNHFMNGGSDSGFINSGGTGEFADNYAMTYLSPVGLKEKSRNRSMTYSADKGRYSGDIRIVVSSGSRKIPSAVSYTFPTGGQYPTVCELSGIRADGKTDLLHSYVCPADCADLTLSFYIGLASDGRLTAGMYENFMFVFKFSALENDTDGVVPKIKLYGVDEPTEKIKYVNYLVKSGGLYSVSTNCEEISIPSSFGGVALERIHDGAFKGALVRSLASVTIPEGVRRISAGAFSDCEKLRNVGLHSTLATGFVDSFNGQSYSGSLYRKELEQQRDIDRDGEIGVPFRFMFINCLSLEGVSVSPHNKDFYSENGIVYNSLGTKVFDPWDSSFILIVKPDIIK